RAPAHPRQDTRVADAAARAAEWRQRRARDRIPAQRARARPDRPRARRRRIGADDPPLPADLTAERVVVEVAKRGKLVVGEPYFVPGVPLVLDRKGLGDVGPGDLVVALAGRGRARVDRALGKADDIEAVLEGLLVHTGARTEFEPYDPPDPSLEGRVDLRGLTTFTIDPETANDFDDAISVREDNGGLRP